MAKTFGETAPIASPKELEANTMLLTPIGSRLYGLHHANSDHDYYRVVPDSFFWKAIGEWPTGKPKRMARQHIKNGIDEITLSFKTFSYYAFSCAPQSLEAMFSQQTIIDNLEEFRNDYFAGIGMDAMRERYRKSIKSFAYGDFKHRRHALRLSINLEEAMQAGGRFNPTLTPAQAETITSIASSSPHEYIKGLESLNRFEVSDEWDMAEIDKQFQDG